MRKLVLRHLLKFVYKMEDIRSIGHPILILLMTSPLVRIQNYHVTDRTECGTERSLSSAEVNPRSTDSVMNDGSGNPRMQVTWSRSLRNMRWININYHHGGLLSDSRYKFHWKLVRTLNPEDAKGMFMKGNKERNKWLPQFSVNGNHLPGWGFLKNGFLKFFMGKKTVALYMWPTWYPSIFLRRRSTASINFKSPTACVSPRMGLVKPVRRAWT